MRPASMATAMDDVTRAWQAQGVLRVDIRREPSTIILQRLVTLFVQRA